MRTVRCPPKIHWLPGWKTQKYKMLRLVCEMARHSSTGIMGQRTTGAALQIPKSDVDGRIGWISENTVCNRLERKLHHEVDWLIRRESEAGWASHRWSCPPLPIRAANTRASGVHGSPELQSGPPQHWSPFIPDQGQYLPRVREQYPSPRPVYERPMCVRYSITLH